MRVIGSRTPYVIRRRPDPRALKAGAAHQRAAAAMAAVRTTGIRQGIYRFRSHADANAHAEQGVIRAIAANLRARKLVR